MRIYIASPYTLGDQALNVRRQIEVADKLLEMGFTPVCPCLLHFWHIVSPKPYETWIRLGLAYLSMCDYVLRLDGKSDGADKEVEFARQRGIPVYYSIEDLQFRRLK